MKHIMLPVLIVMLLSTFSIAQTSKLDSLENCLQQQAKEDTAKVNLLNEIAEEYLDKDKEKALLFIQKADSLASLVFHDHGKAKSQLLMGKLYYMDNNFTQAIVSFKESLELFRELNDNKAIAESFFNIAEIYSDQGNLSISLDYYENALFIMKEISDTLGLIRVTGSMGSNYAHQGKYPKALEYYQQSLRLAEEINTIDRIATTLGNIGTIYFDDANYDKALGYYNKALKINLEEDDKYGIGINYGNIGNVYSISDNFSKALEYHHKALDITIEINDEFGIARNKNNIGLIYLNTAEFEDALECFEEALIIFEELEVIGGVSIVLGNIAETYMFLGKYTQALNYSQKSLLFAEKTESLNRKKFAYKNLVEVYKKIGNYKKALEYKNLWVEVKDSIFNEANLKELTNLENQYQFDKEKEAIAAEQAKKDTLQIAEASRQKQLRNLFIGGAVIFFILSLIIFRSLIQKRKTNLLLAEQNNEIEEQSQELKATNDSLIELSSFKEDITNMVVHDLKNPISAIINIDLIEDETRRVEIVKHVGHKMMSLVQNILDVYKYKSLEMELNKSSVNLSLLLNQAIEEVAFIANQRHLEFQINLEHNTKINADASIIHRILVNILSNAVKFAPQNSKITISAAIESANNLRMSIHNSGMHIPKDKQQHIFEKFGQFEKRDQGEIHSTGLGLTFCQLAVKAHQGEIGVLSAENQGVEFWIILPEAEIIDQLDPIELENSYTQNLISLTETEKEGLSQILPLLEKLSVNEISAFRRVSSIIKDKNLGSTQWNTALEEAVYNCNQNQFQDLVSLIKK